MPFTGRATHSTGIFNGMDIDVSEQISMISPFETPFLDRLAEPEQEAHNVFHEWLEDELNPNTIVSSATLISSTNAVNLGVANLAGSAVTQYLQVGSILRNKTSGEYIQISAISGNTITVTRAFGGTTIATIGAGDQLFIISDAALEGADVAGDISRPRSRLNNYTQIFKKDIIISGTQQAVTQLGVSDELDYQIDKRLRESLRDLEKAVIQGRLSGNSLGTASAYRTFQGVWNFMTSNVTSLSTLTPDLLDTIIQGAWDNGGTDCNLIVCDAKMKRIIDGWNTTRTRVMNEDERYHQRVSFYEGTFGTFEVILDRWCIGTTLMVVSPSRIKVLPLKGRSFRYTPVAITGDSTKGMVIGEYTIEFRNEAGMAKAFGSW